MALLDALVTWMIWTALMGIGRSIYDYQTLIAGILAVGAAYWAARPVWRQLGLTQTQSNGVLREMLLQRQLEIQQAGGALKDRVGSKLNELDHLLAWQNDGEKISEDDAFGFDQLLSTSITWLRLGYHWRDSSQVEAARDELIDKLDALLKVLAEIHAPAHTQQHDEDHDISDEDWAAFIARGEAAKDELQASALTARSAFRQLLDAMEAEAATLKRRLTKLNEALIMD